jgi:hypothetical protein
VAATEAAQAPRVHNPPTPEPTPTGFLQDVGRKAENMIKYNVEYFTNNRWNHYSGPHNNINSAICNASVVSGCRKSNARILEDGVVKDEGNAFFWEGKLNEKEEARTQQAEKEKAD